VIHDDLLAQAEHLCQLDPRRPRQANIRRAVSSAYYAAFHCLAESVAGQVAPGRRADMRALVRRAVEHGAMRSVARSFASGAPAAIYAPTLEVPLDADLLRLADGFIQLQEARHVADYDLSRNLSREFAETCIGLGRQVLRRDAKLRAAKSTNYEVFLLALLLQKNLDKR
jgi:hypothetical protein